MTHVVPRPLRLEKSGERLDIVVEMAFAAGYEATSEWARSAPPGIHMRIMHRSRCRGYRRGSVCPPGPLSGNSKPLCEGLGGFSVAVRSPDTEVLERY